MTLSLGSADRQLGLLATLMDRFDDADEHFKAALDMNARLRARPALAWTKRDYAAMLLRRNAAGDRERALVLVDEALAIANDIGMARVTADATALRDRILAG